MSIAIGIMMREARDIDVRIEPKIRTAIVIIH